METRVLGRTGRRLSVIGFGGIVVQDVSPADAAMYVARAIDRGINYFDVAPSYGNAEERLGPAIEPYRERILAENPCSRPRDERCDANPLHHRRSSTGSRGRSRCMG